MEIDEQFLGRVYLASAVVWVVGVAVSWVIAGLPCAAGWTAGSALSIGVLRALDWFVRRKFVPGESRAKSDFAKFTVVRLPIIGLFLSAVVVLGGRSFALIGGFCAGVVLTQSVIVAKTLGVMLAGRAQDG